MNIEQLRSQIEQTTSRYNKAKNRRDERSKNFKDLGRDGDLSKVDSKERIISRLKHLGKSSLVGKIRNDEEINLSSLSNVNILERIIGEDDLLGSKYLTDGARVGRAVGRVIDQGSGFGFGTGFLVSPRLLMTNNHVLRTKSEAANSSIQFDYVDGIETNPIVFKITPNDFFITNVSLDYTLVAIEEINVGGIRSDSRGWLRLIPESGKTLVTENASIIQHPGGQTQKVALRNNRITDVVDDFLHYESDTQPGSSGSPVCNDQWELSALHHAGVPKKDAAGKYLLKDGSIWDGSKSTVHLIAWVANEGVRISRIVEDLRSRLSNERLSWSDLLEQAFSPPPRSDHPVYSHLKDKQHSSNTSGISMTQKGNKASITIPLNIDLTMGFGSSNSIANLVHQPSDDQDQPNTELDHDLDREIQSGIREFEDASTRTYFDEEADFQACEEYYQDWPGSATEDDWFDYFSSLVRNTHSTVLSYRRARLQHLYPWIDLRPDELNLRSVYSGERLDAREVLLAELKIERLRNEALKKILSNESLSEEDFELELLALENQFPFNCEHVVPQSWFSKRQPMRADLHHLFTCEPRCNSYRSNIPYWDFSVNPEEARPDHCGLRSDDKFEPEAGHGTVARATLYFILRYPGLVGDHSRELRENRLPILLNWHNDDPADEYEWHRNHAIYEVQGNRNPLIDYPSVSEVINFSRGLGG